MLSSSDMLATDQDRVGFGLGSVLHFPPGVEHAAETVLVAVNLPA